MPFQGADLTSAALQKTANPSSKWSSTYHSMYQNPMKYTKRQDYWLKRGCKRTSLLKQKLTMERSASSQALHYQHERPTQTLGASIPLSATRPTRRSEGGADGPFSATRQVVYDSYPLHPAYTAALPKSSTLPAQSMRRSQSLPAASSRAPMSPSKLANIVYEPEYVAREYDTYEQPVYVAGYEPSPSQHQQLSSSSSQTWIRPVSAVYRSSAPVRTQIQQVHSQNGITPSYEPYPLYQNNELRAQTPYNATQQQAQAWQ